MDTPLCGSTVMSHNEFTIRKPIEPQEASPRSSQQSPQSTRRNTLPVKLIDGALVMDHEDLACAVG
jgi:hypothetical protein